jgi:hypothetical protein
MMVVLLVAGIGFLLAGLVAIGFGIPINEFGFGNTLILAGTVATCSGMLLLGLWTAVRELKNIALRLGPAVPAGLQGSAPEAAIPGAAAHGAAAESGGFMFSGDQRAADDAGTGAPAVPPASPPPWQEEAASRDRAAGEAPEPAVKPRRNLLFS